MVAIKRPRLVLFDIDGTLLKTSGAGRESTRRAMHEVFGTVGKLDVHHFGGKTDWQTLLELLGEDGYTRDHIGEAMPRYHEAMARHLDSIMVDFTVTRCAGAWETVEALRVRAAEQGDISLGLVTGNVKDAANVKLRAAGYDPSWFPVGAFGHEALERDLLPPIAIARAAAYYQYDFKPDQVIVIGDTAMDIACARACGASVIAVGTGFSTRDELLAAAPDAYFDDLFPIAEHLDRLEQTNLSKPLI